MKSKGFSLVELLLTLSLITILMTYGYKSYHHSRISVEAEMDRQFILQISILLEEYYAENLIYPTQLGDILNTSSHQAYTPKSYYLISYKQTGNNSYKLNASLNSKKKGTDQVECVQINTDEAGEIKAFNKAGNLSTSACWK